MKMEEIEDQSRDLFAQDGVLLKHAPLNYTNFYKNSGTLYITEYANKVKWIEWKSQDVTIDAIQDQEWAVVNTVDTSARRTRTLSGSTVDNTNYRNIKIKINEIKSFKISKKHDNLTFIGGDGETIIGFLFLHGNCKVFVDVLNTYIKSRPSKRDKSLYVIMNEDIEAHKLSTSFAELNLFQDEPTFVWKFFKNFHSRPYETTIETFSKIQDIGT